MGVYDPVLSEEREDFGNELSPIRGLWSDPWRVGEDFHVVRFPREGETANPFLLQ